MADETYPMQFTFSGHAVMHVDASQYCAHLGGRTELINTTV